MRWPLYLDKIRSDDWASTRLLRRTQYRDAGPLTPRHKCAVYFGQWRMASGDFRTFDFSGTLYTGDGCRSSPQQLEEEERDNAYDKAGFLWPKLRNLGQPSQGVIL